MLNKFVNGGIDHCDGIVKSSQDGAQWLWKCSNATQTNATKIACSKQRFVMRMPFKSSTTETPSLRLLFLFLVERCFACAFFSCFQTTDEEGVTSKRLVHILNSRAQF